MTKSNLDHMQVQNIQFGRCKVPELNRRHEHKVAHSELKRYPIKVQKNYQNHLYIYINSGSETCVTRESSIAMVAAAKSRFRTVSMHTTVSTIG